VSCLLSYACVACALRIGFLDDYVIGCMVPPFHMYPYCRYIIYRVNSLLAMKKTCDSLLAIKNFNFPIRHWIEILFLVSHPSVQVGEQMSFLPLTTFLCLTFLLTMNLDNMSFKI
jgi:hypothetical protein